MSSKLINLIIFCYLITGLDLLVWLLEGFSIQLWIWLWIQFDLQFLFYLYFELSISIVCHEIFFLGLLAASFRFVYLTAEFVYLLHHWALLFYSFLSFYLPRFASLTTPLVIKLDLVFCPQLYSGASTGTCCHGQGSALTTCMPCTTSRDHFDYFFRYDNTDSISWVSVCIRFVRSFLVSYLLVFIAFLLSAFWTWLSFRSFNIFCWILFLLLSLSSSVKRFAYTLGTLLLMSFHLTFPLRARPVWTCTCCHNLLFKKRVSILVYILGVIFIFVFALNYLH